MYNWQRDFVIKLVEKCLSLISSTLHLQAICNRHFIKKRLNRFYCCPYYCLTTIIYYLQYSALIVNNKGKTMATVKHLYSAAVILLVCMEVDLHGEYVSKSQKWVQGSIFIPLFCCLCSRYNMGPFTIKHTLQS